MVEETPQPAKPAASQPETPGQTLLDLTAGGSGPPQDSASPTRPGLASTRVLAQESSGPKIGRYRVLKEHARGGMGRVLLAVDTTIGRKVALKELLSGLRNASGTPETAATKSIGERFLREARVTGRLEHPNIVPVYEIGTGDDGNLFYSMRFVGGRTLAAQLDEIKARNLPEREKLAARLQLLEAFYDMCNAVAYAHSKGVIHRDLKPSNVMLGEFGETVVLDWGLARVLDEAEEPTQARGGGEGDSLLTLDGDVVGTPSYMPPEQAQGDRAHVNQLSDVYSLGAVLYEILTGQAPFTGGAARAILQRVISEAPRPVLELAPLVPRELAVLCARAMEREPARRLSSALDLAREIKAFRDGKTLASYEYSSAELLLRFLRRQWKLVAVVALALLSTGVIGAIALNEVVSERNVAQNALELARSEAEKKVLAQQEADRKSQELLASRESAIQRAKEALQGYNAEPMLRDLYLRVESYAKTPATLRQLDLQERERNRALITAVLGYAAQLQELIRLSSAGLEAAADGRLSELQRIQAALIELAIADADFELAKYLLSGSNLPEAAQAELTQRSAQTRLALLDWRAHKILDCLDDARLGLRREGRQATAPRLPQYISMLGDFQDEQTIQMLAAELKQLQTRLRVLDRAPHVIEFDLADLLCSALGRLQKPHSVIPVLREFLSAQSHPRILAAALGALAALQHRDATLCMFEEAKRRGLHFLESNREIYARAYLPPEMPDSQPEVAGFFFFARESYERAQSLLAKTDSSHANVYRSLALLALNRPAEAHQLLQSRRATEPENLQCLLALSRTQEAAEAKATLDLAARLAPDSPQPLFERALFYRDRATERALQEAEELVRRWPDSADFWYLKGELLRMLSRFEASIQAYDRAIALDPDYALAWLFKAEMLRTLGQPFIEAAQRAVELSPQESHALAYLCQAYFFAGDYEKAIETGKRAVALRPDEQEAWHFVGLSYLRMRADGTDGLDSINARAGLAAERHYLEEAIKAFQGLLNFNPRDCRSRTLMGESLATLGRDSLAREALGLAEDSATLDVHVLGVPTTYIHRILALVDARAARVAEPRAARELLGNALIEAFEAGQEPDAQAQRKGLRLALVHLEQGEKLLDDSAPREVRQLARRARYEIALWLRRGRFFHLVPEVLRLALANEPAWLTLPYEYDVAESLIALGLQYREGHVNFLGRDDADLQRLEGELDGMTGIARRQRGERLIDEGVASLKEMAARGYQASFSELNPVLLPLREDSRLKSALEVLAQAKPDPGHPYRVVVVKGVRRGMQAQELGVTDWDVIESVGGIQVSSLQQLRAALEKLQGRESFELVIRRFERTEKGRLVPMLDQQGRPLCDERGNPKFASTEQRFKAKPGTLGVSLVDGMVPHPLDE